MEGTGGTGQGQQPEQPTHELSKPLQDRVDAATAAKAEADARAAEAAARSAEIKAASDAVAARLALAKSFVPDLSGVKPGTLDVKASTPSYGSVLSFAALRKIATRIAADTEHSLPKSAVVLVTSDLDLATADATYVEVESGLAGLLEAAREVLRVVDRASRKPQHTQEDLGAATVAGA